MKIGFDKLTAVLIFMVLASQAQAGAVDTLQQQYTAAGAGPFSAAAGEQRWKETHLDAKSGKQRSCQTCHTKDLTKSGKHARTGKVIDPMAPSANTERFTQVRDIKKWFKRNCKWVLGRECTAQEKGDFLEYLKGQ
jgi:hypothetical protein